VGDTPTRDHQAMMTDSEVLAAASADGFELIERMSAGRWAVGWARGDDARWPCYLEERQAINWMARPVEPRTSVRGNAPERAIWRVNAAQRASV
jgi:hypothetical protein